MALETASASSSLSSTEIDYLRTLLNQRAAIQLEVGKAYLAEARLLPVARRNGFHSVSELVVRMRTSQRSGLHEQVVEAMTINETSFYRDIQPFEALKKEILPKAIQKRGGERSLLIWSAASSSGQEAYSIAMLIREHFPQLGNWDVRVLGTDLSAAMVERCKKGCYSQLEVNRGLPANLLVKYFRRMGLEWEISDEIKRLTEFRQQNLIEPFPPLLKVDVIFLRNVLIYFSAETRKEILLKMSRVLRPGGVLILGGAETVFGLDDKFERVTFERAGFYRLKG